MTNRQVQREAQRERRREERQKVRRQVRQVRPPTVAPRAAEDEPEKRSLPWVWMAVGVIAAALLAVGIVFLLKSNNAPLPGQTFESLGNQHINPGDAHPPYNSNPPTSGWHYPTWPQRGIYTAPLPEEYLLHFQEHAGIVVHYNPDKLPPDQLTKLRNLVNQELNKGQGLVVLSPDPDMPQPLAVTSWQHLVPFETVGGNEGKLEDAIERLQCNYDPEGVCGPPHGKSFQPTGTPVPGVATVIGAPIPSGVPQGNTSPGQVPETPGAATPAP
jgi:hypothetical protein